MLIRTVWTETETAEAASADTKTLAARQKQPEHAATLVEATAS